MGIFNGPHSHFAGAKPGAVAEAGAMEQLKTWLAGYVDGKLAGYSPDVDTDGIKADIMTAVDEKLANYQAGGLVFIAEGEPPMGYYDKKSGRFISYDYLNESTPHYTMEICGTEAVKCIHCSVVIDDSNGPDVSGEMGSFHTILRVEAFAPLDDGAGFSTTTPDGCTLLAYVNNGIVFAKHGGMLSGKIAIVSVYYI